MSNQKSKTNNPKSIPQPTTDFCRLLFETAAEAILIIQDDRIVDWEASLWHTESDALFVTADGGRVHQVFSYVVPM